MIKFFRQYQKVAFWLVIIFILPTFSISFIMMDVLTGGGPGAAGTLFGEEIGHEQIRDVGARLSQYATVLGLQPPSDRDAATWQHLALVEKTEREGVRVTDDEVGVRIRTLYTQRIALERAIQEVRSDPQLQRLAQFGPSLYQNLVMRRRDEIAKTVQFDEKGYQALLSRAGTTAGSFEDTVREKMRIRRMEAAAMRTADADPNDLYVVYQDQNHQRSARTFAVRGSDWLPSSDDATEDELKAHYEKHQDRFSEPAKVELEYLLFPMKDFAEQAAAPTEAEILARYDRDKETYRLPDETPPTATSTAATATSTAATTATSTPRYRALADVHDGILVALRDERAIAAARTAAQDVRKLLVAEIGAGKTVDLPGFALQNSAIHGTTGLIPPVELIEQKEIRGDLLLQTRVRQQKVGDISEVKANDENVFIYRVAQKKAAREIPFAECRDRVVSSYVDGHEDDLRSHYGFHVTEYREPERVKVDMITIPLARFRKDVPADVTGDDRTKRLKELAEEKLQALKQKSAKLGPEGRRPDLETVALDLDLDFETIKVRPSGEDLAANLNTVEIQAYLAKAREKGTNLSQGYDTKPGDAIVAFRSQGVIPARTRPFEEVKDKVKAAVLAERGYVRAQARARDAVKALTLRPGDFMAEAKKARATVRETKLLGREDKADGQSSSFTSRLFSIAEVGLCDGPVLDDDAQTATVLRWIERKPAPADGFEEKREELLTVQHFWEDLQIRETAAGKAKAEARLHWLQAVELEAHGLGTEQLGEAFRLFYGAGGTEAIEASHLYVAADEETISEALTASAEKRLTELRAQIEAGELDFHLAAKKHSDDEKTRRDGGILRFGTPEYRELAAFTRGFQPGQMSGVLKTDRGYHLVQLVGMKGNQPRLKHILASTTPTRDAGGHLTGVPTDIMQKAMAKARAKVEAALKRIHAGERFDGVAREVSTDPQAVEVQRYAYYTPFERAVLALNARSKTAKRAIQLVSEPIVEAGGAHLVIAQETSLGALEVKPLKVWHIYKKGSEAVKALTSLREDLKGELEDDHEEKETIRKERQRLVKLFEELARKESEAPTAGSGGILGIILPSRELQRWGTAFETALYDLEPGKVSGLVEGPDGIHLIRVKRRIQRSADEANLQLAGGLLRVLRY